jgi:acyl-CoA thioesterase
MTALDVLTAPRDERDGSFSFEIPDHWQQGRGAFGGLVLAMLTRAMQATVADSSRALRTLTASLSGPVLVGRAEVSCASLRVGANLSSIVARMDQASSHCAHASAVFARERALDYMGFVDVAPPSDLARWREVDPVLVAPPLGPTFAQHFEFRPRSGLPFSGDREARTEGWIRPREPGVSRGAAYVVALADAWWPALLVRLAAPRPTATVSFTLELVGDCEGLDPEAPLFHRARCDVVRGGFALETRELWGHDQRLIAVNHQVFALIK